MAIIESLGSGALGMMVLVIAIIFFGGVAIIGTWFYMTKIRVYNQANVIIWEKDAFGQIREKYDKAGVFVDDKTKNKLFFLKKGNVGLKPDNIPFIHTSGKKPVVYLLQVGLKNYRFLKPVLKDDLVTYTVSEEDVNWAINSYDRQKRLFSQSWIAQYLPFILLAFVSIIILILFVYLFKQFPLIKEMMVEMKEVAKALAQAKAGTVVVS